MTNGDLMNWPRISIVTPSFNQGRFLEQTITSVLGQNYPNLEYIVMDGGSTDDSVNIIRKYADRMAYWTSEKDNGQADAIARGFARATGELIGWVNSDDVLYEGALRHMVEAYRAHPQAGFLAGGSVLIDQEGKLIKTWYRTPHFFWSRGPISHRRLLFRGASFLQPGTLWTRQLYESVGGVDTSLRFCMDSDLFLRLARVRPAYGISRIVAGYRLHPESKTCSWQHIWEEERRVLNDRYGYWDSPAWQRKPLRLRCAIGNRLGQLVNCARYLVEPSLIPEFAHV